MLIDDSFGRLRDKLPYLNSAKKIDGSLIDNKYLGVTFKIQLKNFSLEPRFQVKSDTKIIIKSGLYNGEKWAGHSSPSSIPISDPSRDTAE